MSTFTLNCMRELDRRELPREEREAIPAIPGFQVASKDSLLTTVVYPDGTGFEQIAYLCPHCSTKEFAVISSQEIIRSLLEAVANGKLEHQQIDITPHAFQHEPSSPLGENDIENFEVDLRIPGALEQDAQQL